MFTTILVTWPLTNLNWQWFKCLFPIFISTRDSIAQNHALNTLIVWQYKLCGTIFIQVLHKHNEIENRNDLDFKNTPSHVICVFLNFTQLRFIIHSPGSNQNDYLVFRYFPQWPHKHVPTALYHFWFWKADVASRLIAASCWTRDVYAMTCERTQVQFNVAHCVLTAVHFFSLLLSIQFLKIYYFAFDFVHVVLTCIDF